MPAQHITSTTQNFLDIYDITSDVVLMKNGAASMIITVNAMNFGLLAEEEQDGVIYAYAGLLNSLNFPIQIVIKSQTKDATNYLNLLKTQEDQTPESNKKLLISRYRDFVSQLIHERNVLDKKFYAVVTASVLEMGLLPPQSVLPGAKPIDISTLERSVVLEKAKNILEPRRDHLLSQFNRIGLYARQINTQEIIQFFYTSYNPEAAEGQQITDSNSYTTPIVQARIQPHYANPTEQQPIVVAPPPSSMTVEPAAPTLYEQPDQMAAVQNLQPPFEVQQPAAPLAQMPAPPPQFQPQPEQHLGMTPTAPVPDIMAAPAAPPVPETPPAPPAPAPIAPSSAVGSLTTTPPAPVPAVSQNVAQAVFTPPADQHTPPPQTYPLPSFNDVIAQPGTAPVAAPAGPVPDSMTTPATPPLPETPPTPLAPVHVEPQPTAIPAPLPNAVPPQASDDLPPIPEIK